ncbi:hypothetical protein [Methylocystis hirsuta]|uniref:hypothetical protein n=1 Tax=Methylocystis hirsuta TaxID=369798 RepID=UPI001FE04E42|nr:hypothetical protein [Methylocystis hirsuta]
MALQLPQNAVVAYRHAQTFHQALSPQAANAMTKKVNELSNPAGSALVRKSNFGQLINTCLAFAIFNATSPSIYP